MALYEMRKFVAPEFIFGVGARHRVGFYAQNMAAHRVLVVSDPGVIAAGWTQQAIDDLHEFGIDTVLFSELTPNPKDYEVMKGAEVYRENECDVIVAVGGGSVIDCAKAIGVVYTNGRDVWGFEGIDKIDIPGPPMICIPTTAGTAADISQFCIVLNSHDRYKMAIISKTMVPDVALIDPMTTTTLEVGLTAATGIDALTHAIEAYVSTASSPIVDVHAITAIDLIWNNLEQAVSEPANVDAREKMMLGSLQAGLAFSNASLGAVHAMAHALGGYLDLPHGECNAMLLDHVIRYNMSASSDKYRQVASAIGIDPKRMTTSVCNERITRAVGQLRDKVNINNRLSNIGVHSTDIPELAKHAYHDACIVTNPRQASIADIKALFSEAM